MLWQFLNEPLGSLKKLWIHYKFTNERPFIRVINISGSCADAHVDLKWFNIYRLLSIVNMVKEYRYCQTYMVQ